MYTVGKKCSVLYLCLVITATELISAGTSSKKKLYFMAVGPLPDVESFQPSWAGGPAVLHAVRLARSHINNRSDILPGYDLEVIEADSGCNIVSKYLIAFARQFIEDSKDRIMAGIIGPGCSDATHILAPVLARDELSVIQIAPSATSSELVNPLYNTTFRIFSSALIYVAEFRELTRVNRWSRVALLYDGTRNVFRTSFQSYLDTKDENVTVSYQSALYNGFFPIAEIRQLQTRVMFVFVSGGIGAKLMCMAYHLEMIFPTFQWIFHDRAEGNFIRNISVTHNSRTYTCTEENMRVASDGIILNNYIFEPIDHNDKSLPVNVSYKEYYNEYNATLEENVTLSSLIGMKWAASFYDATWALALAINKSLPHLESRGLSLENYTLGRRDITEIITGTLLNASAINFKGVSESRVKFDPKTRHTTTTLGINKLCCNSTTCTQEQLGIYNESALQLYPSARNAFINDSFQQITATVHVAFGSIILLATFCVLVIVILLQLTTIVYYNFKPIKATSPNLSHLIFSGCYLLLVSVVFFAIKDAFDFDAIPYGMMCNVLTLCISLGFSLVFGTICAKIWRVYRIFRHFRTDRAAGAISDYSLILFVILLLFVDILLGIFWIIFDPWLRRTTGEFSGTEIVVRSSCHCEHLLKWLLATAAYKSLLILVVVLLAILNRNIQRKEFKHTKKVSMYVYTEILFGGITLPIYQIISGINFTAGSVIMSLFLLVTVCGCLAFVFLPSVLPLMRIKYRGQPVSIHMTRRSTVLLLN